MIKTVIAGVTGYTGQELLRYLSQHPHVHVESCISSSQAGKRLNEAGIAVPDHLDLVLEASDSSVVENADVLFSCLPHGSSAPFIASVLARNSDIKVIDLSADFRFHDSALYQRVYGKEHPVPEKCQEAAYGLPELNRDTIRNASIVANPGCYPTAFLLACAPLVREGLCTSFIYDAKSGISGAGKKTEETYLFAELQENSWPYSVFSHRHEPEMEHQGERLLGHSLRVFFAPQVMPASRGILGMVYARLEKDISAEDLRSLYADFYCAEPFVKLLPPGKRPETSMVRGTNNAVLQLYTHQEETLVCISVAIDNLGKGAAGQAVQNMNLMFALPEEEGLPRIPLKI